jgi:hypothetical protein
MTCVWHTPSDIRPVCARSGCGVAVVGGFDFCVLHLWESGVNPATTNAGYMGPPQYESCQAETRDSISGETRPCRQWALLGSEFCNQHDELHSLLTGDEPVAVDVDALAFLADVERLLSHAPANMLASEHDSKGGGMSDDTPDIDLAGIDASRAEFNDLIENAPEDKREELAALMAPYESYATRSKAKTTFDGYTSVLRHWRTFNGHYNQPPLPADPRMVAAYLAWLMQRGRVEDGEPLSLSYFRTLLSALNLEHANFYAGEKDAPPPPGDHPMVRRIVEGYSRTDAPGRKPAYVPTAEDLGGMVITALTPRQGVYASTLLAGLLIGSPATSISQPQLGMLAYATVDAVRFEKPEDPASGCAFLTLHNLANGARHEVTVHPETDQPAICPVRQLHAAVTLRRIEGSSAPMLPNASAEPISRQGIVKNVRRAFERIEGAEWNASGWSLRVRLEFVRVFEGVPLAGRRNVAVLLTATWAGMRRSEVGNLLVGDLGFSLAGNERDQTVNIFVEKSKTDQSRKGEVTPVGHGFYGPGLSVIHALIKWLTAYEIEMGLTTAAEAEATLAAGRTPGSLLDPTWPLFPHILKNDQIVQPLSGLSGDAIGDIYVKCATEAGIEANFGERLTSHGMRAAQTVILAENGVPLATANALARRSDNSATGALYYRSARLAEATKPPLDVDGEATSTLRETYFSRGPN